jgi:hypothetical protein
MSYVAVYAATYAQASASLIALLTVGYASAVAPEEAAEALRMGFIQSLAFIRVQTYNLDQNSIS